MLKCVRMRSTTHAGAAQSPGRRRRRRLLGCSALSHLGRPRPLSPLGTHCLGPRTFLLCPTKVKLGTWREPEVPCDLQILSRKRKWSSVAGWRPEVTVPWGSRGRSRGVVVCVLGVFGCDALLEHRRRQKRGLVSQSGPS